MYYVRTFSNFIIFIFIYKHKYFRKNIYAIRHSSQQRVTANSVYVYVYILRKDIYLQSIIAVQI